MEYQVIIVGAGPTGLMLAGELELAGVATLVLDKLTGPNPQSRAGSLQPRTAEVLDLRGLLAPLLGDTAGIRRHGGHFAGLPVPLDCTPWQTRYPTPVPVPQGRLEQFLEQRLRERGTPVLRGAEVVGVERTADGVAVTTAAGATLHAQYLVACDGAHSIVRKVLGVPFPGTAGTRFSVVADVALAARSAEVPDSAQHFSNHIRAAEGYWTVLSPLDGGLYRFMFGRTTGPAVPRETPITAAEVTAALQAVHGPGTELGEVRAASRFSDATRQLTDYRSGRVFFAGDAAHIHLPVGGQGVNLGIQDAVNLGWKLAAELGGRAPAGLLDTYQAERHPVGAQVLRNTKAQGVLLNPIRDQDVDALREIFTAMMRLPDANRYLSGMIAGLDICYDRAADDHPLIGYRMPDLDLVTDSGPVRLSDLMHDGRGLLLHLDGPGLSVGGRDDRVRHVIAKATGDVAADAVLVRPDGHVCWAGPNPTGLAPALDRWFAAPAR
ncbi:FAD-dependent monooxygenase [Nocardia sp. alder85J]|uniref:FAD-dependent monooxygenase n=1 Tax=Nocardia sp. alder85J TaxID=2862949 RepID=UPI001CD43DE6|nr:FAD-dependent monooxygenase [Nocardia sp. alder85J]MCX4094615.1 FAD-dependent monooxygenase [Nocardia sp. alder85J]